MAKAQNIEVTFDRQARDSIRSLVGAIDRLSAAIVNGDDVEALASDPENVEVLRRLVEDVKRRQTSDGQPLPDDESYYRDADGRLRRDGTYSGADGRLRTVEGGALA